VWDKILIPFFLYNILGETYGFPIPLPFCMHARAPLEKIEKDCRFPTNTYTQEHRNENWFVENRQRKSHNMY